MALPPVLLWSTLAIVASCRCYLLGFLPDRRLRGPGFDELFSLRVFSLFENFSSCLVTEVVTQGKALPLCNVPEAARQGIFRSSPRRVFSVWPYCGSCKKDHSQWIGYCSSGMHSGLAFCAGVCKILAEDNFSGTSGAD